MKKQSKPRDRSKTEFAIMEHIRLAQMYGVSKATAHSAARAANVTPQYARRIMMDWFQMGAVGYRVEQHRPNAHRRVWVTRDYALRHKNYVLIDKVGGAR